MNRDREEFADPVELPEGVHHATQTAYGPAHRCRCRYCVKWRRMYDQLRDARERAARTEYQGAARAYLIHRGVLIYDGPLKRRPLILARWLASYLGDNLEDWKEGTS